MNESWVIKLIPLVHDEHGVGAQEDRIHVREASPISRIVPEKEQKWKEVVGKSVEVPIGHRQI
jgi:hypothetical protein